MTVINKKKVSKNVIYKKTFFSCLPYLLTYTKKKSCQRKSKSKSSKLVIDLKISIQNINS